MRLLERQRGNCQWKIDVGDSQPKVNIIVGLHDVGSKARVGRVGTFLNPLFPHTHYATTTVKLCILPKMYDVV